MEQFIELVKFISGFSLLALAGLGWAASQWTKTARDEYKIPSAILLSLALILVLISTYQLVWLLKEVSFQALLDSKEQNYASSDIKCAITVSIWTLIAGTISIAISLPFISAKRGPE